MKKILHIINDLAPGGAEYSLKRLITDGKFQEFEHVVIALTELESCVNILEDSDVRFYSLRMSRKVPNPLIFFQICKIMLKEKPQLIHAWMYASILVSSFVVKIFPTPVIWGLHHNDLEPKHQKKTTTITIRTCARLSHTIPQKIIACGESVRKNHVEFGFNLEKMVIIPNGIDTDLFTHSEKAHSEFKLELGLNENIKLIGIASRFHPIKDHSTFLKAASIIMEQRNDVHFILCGYEMTEENETLKAMIYHFNLMGKCHLLGLRNDMPRIFAAWDVAVSSSRSEALPTAVMEAMACGIPCVATDVGDTRFIIGDCGVVVPAGNPKELAKGVFHILSLNKKKTTKLSEKSRERIIQQFSIRIVRKEYDALYKENM